MVEEKNGGTVPPEKTTAIAERPGDYALAILDTLEQTALSRLKRKDLVDIGGEPYLTQDGCNKVLNYLLCKGFNYSFLNTTRELTDGQTLDGRAKKEYVVKGTMRFEFPGGGVKEVETIGTCGTDDKLFGFVGDTPKSLDDINIGNIQKKAYTNALRRGLAEAFDCSGWSWQDIERICGVKQEDCKSIKHEKGKQGGKTMGTPEIEKMRSKIKEGFADVFGTDIEASKKWLLSVTAFGTYKGVYTVDYISAKQVPMVFEKLKDLCNLKNISTSWADEAVPNE